MKIISHRGNWKTPEEKNTKTAFVSSLNLGFGIETDLRDFNGNLVIAHDIATETCMDLKHFFKIVNCFKKDEALPLALNIKADGLQILISDLLHTFEIENYFLFDMSIPDMKASIDCGLNVFLRLSEFEKDLPFYKEIEGIWLDAFYSTWYDSDMMMKHLKAGKKIAIVSAELHKRDHIMHWNELLKMECIQSDSIILCTDFPEEAKLYFKHV